MKTKQQAKQARNLQAAKKELKKEKSDLKATLRLTPDAKLSSRDKRRLAASVSKAKRDGRLPKTAQQTIPYQEMCRDGICIIGDRYFTKQIQFYDVNYQLAQNEDKNLIFENYCDFLNYFDSSIKVQLSFLNKRADMEEYQKSIHIPEQTDVTLPSWKFPIRMRPIRNPSPIVRNSANGGYCLNISTNQSIIYIQR